MEIERKFIPLSLPQDLEKYRKKEIAQAYLCTAPVVRIRKSNDDYYLTYKSGGMMARQEVEVPLTRESFFHMLPKADGRIIEKTRYLIPLEEGLTAELDLFHGDLAGLRLVEVEFPTEEAATTWQAPAWFGADVTYDGRYHNSYMCMADDLSDILK